MPILATAIAEREKVTATWDKADKPKFVPKITLKGGIIRTHIQIKARAAISASVSVWRLLNDGTSVIRGFMTADFERKTTPGQFTSRVGMGSFSHVDTSVAFPGIDEGQWDELANAAMLPEIEAALDNAIRGT